MSISETRFLCGEASRGAACGVVHTQVSDMRREGAAVGFEGGAKSLGEFGVAGGDLSLERMNGASQAVFNCLNDGAPGAGGGDKDGADLVVIFTFSLLVGVVNVTT